MMTCTAVHDVDLANHGDPTGNFDALWCEALNAYEDGTRTHFAMLHADVIPQEDYWLDVLLEEMDRFQVGLVSAAIAIKDNRKLVSAGIGDPSNPWLPLRRLTKKELGMLPETFGAEEMGYPGGCLLHNNGCWVADLRRPEWRAVNTNGHMIASFQFPRRNYRHPETKRWMTEGESEDWYFSRMAHQLGVPSKVTRKVWLHHRGVADYSNREEAIPTGYQNGDEDTRHKWDKE